MKNADQPINPDPMRAAEQTLINENPHEHPTGLTKREYFAGLAMQGLLSSFTAKAAHGNWGTEIEGTISKAIKYADELLKQLEK